MTRGSTIIAATPSLRETLHVRGIVPRKRFGQNFLHDPAVAERIVREAGVQPGEPVIEIGPGLGALTGPLLGRGARVTAVEIDPRLGAFLRETWGDRPGLTLLVADVLEQSWDELAPSPAVWIGNLPYSITGPILDRLIRHAPSVSRAVLMMQREVAQRLVSRAGGKEIGAPAVHLRLLYDIERLFDVGSGAFHPAPDVVSSVVRFTPRPRARLDPFLRETVNRAFLHRRKKLRKTLASPAQPEPEWARALERIGRSPDARPEELEPDDWPRLLAAIREGRA
jgi:16S rRNA (adenine1518-N6/adenine1519-N6)-dimethyltransferase